MSKSNTKYTSQKKKQKPSTTKIISKTKNKIKLN